MLRTCLNQRRLRASGCFIFLVAAFAGVAGQIRSATNDAELAFWLTNMTRHAYSLDEMSGVLGFSTNRVAEALGRFQIGSRAFVPRAVDSLLVLPYPGGRHPRIGFLDGAVDPQRETKFSVFMPWDPPSYVVIDLPEAIFSNLGLIYLAHTHVPTVWSQQGVTLQSLEWKRHADGSLESERALPNHISFGAKVQPRLDSVLMELWLRNGTSEPLTNLRVQNCVMLKAASGFNQQTNVNKLFASPYIACRDAQTNHWVITAWEPCHRTWANPPVPCLHSDPKFPDCAPGATARVRGWFSFYEGSNIDGELKRIDATGWRP